MLDVQLPDGNGLEALPAIRTREHSPEVIIITGVGDCSGAELAIKSGAWDYIEKPSSVHNMSLPLVRALQYREGIKAAKSRGSVKALNRDGIIGESPKLRELFDVLAQVAESDINVLITGETGTGKELFAHAIHRNSVRAEKPFVVLDCSTLPEALVESLLFGHAKGAFTGADRARTGLIRQADGGTLFLDEVGELPLSIQKAFLRVLEERRFRPVGDGCEVESNFRLVAATNRNLQTMTNSGLFREDLLFRLKSFTIELPPLRERPGDIRELVMHFISKFCDSRGIGLKGFCPEFMDVLAAYHWPGNVRELFRVLERALAAARYEPTLYPKHLPDEIRIHSARTSLGRAVPNPKGAPPGMDRSAGIPTLRDFREEMDRKYLQDLMGRTHGDIREACRKSGLSRSRFYELLKYHGTPGSA